MAHFDVEAIKSLIVTERFARDTGQWIKLRNSYHPEPSKTKLHTMWFHGDIDGFIEGSKKLHTRSGDIIHKVLPADVEIHGSRAVVDCWCFIEARLTLNDVEVELNTSLRLLYRCEKVESEWKLLTLEPIYIRDRIDSVPPATAVTFPDLSKFRKSYRFTAWMVGQRGISISHDLPGEDVPESVAEIYERHQKWARDSASEL